MKAETLRRAQCTLRERGLPVGDWAAHILIAGPSDHRTLNAPPSEHRDWPAQSAFRPERALPATVSVWVLAPSGWARTSAQWSLLKANRTIRGPLDVITSDVAYTFIY
jgi:hypothetical protein